MTKDTFKLVTELDGTEYLVQNIYEVDKNHRPDDYDATNQGCMHGNEGKLQENKQADPIYNEFEALKSDQRLNKISTFYIFQKEACVPSRYGSCTCQN